MERSAIRSVAFGGFDKEDVARYIEQLSQETENSGKNGTLYRKKQTAWRRKQTN